MSVSAPYPFIDIAGEAPADRMVRYQQYKASIDAALSQAAGFEREQLLAKSADAQKALDNAREIAQIQARTSRYGADAQSKSALEKLQQDADQFDATHQLDMQKFGLDVQKTGLDYANTATQYLSTPSRFMQAADFVNMAGRALGRTTNGVQGAAPYAQGMTPVPKNENDFAVLAGYTQPTASGLGAATTASSSPTADVINNAGAVGAGTTQSALQSTSGAGTDSGDVVAAAGGGSDARVKALKAMIDAVPPSGVDGLNNNDYAVLSAAKALYSTNLTPGVYAQMRPGQKAILQSAGQRLGYDTNDWQAQQARNGLGMGSVRGY